MLAPSPSRLLFLPLLLLVGARSARAECFIVDGFGNVVCTGLSTGARIGIAIAVFVAAMAFLLGLVYWQRRRVRNRNLVYLSNPPLVYPSYDPSGQPYGAYGGYPQYPPQTYGGQPYNGYDPQFSGADKHNLPSYSYAPPPGAPPATTKA